MKIVKLHSKSTEIVYKNSICSMASVIVFATLMLSIVIPVLLVSLLSPYSGITDSRILYEQPDVNFLHKFVFVAEVGESLIVCSTFPYLNEVTKELQKCSRMNYWSEDRNYDRKTDMANFELNVDVEDEDGYEIKNFFLVLFFEAKINHKCDLMPPAVIIQELEIPSRHGRNVDVIIKGRLGLSQNAEFVCPFFGRNLKTFLNSEIIHQNVTSAEPFKLESIRNALKRNAGYFVMDRTETYMKKVPQNGLHITLSLDINQLPVRYHLNIWERLGQFWLYFASFFGISFFVMNKLKDLLFSRHILRSWEIIPWKKLY